MKSLIMDMGANAIYKVLTIGPMRVQASHLSDENRQQIVGYLTGKRVGTSSSHPLFMCDRKVSELETGAQAVGTGWGIDATNSRALNAKQAGFGLKDLKRLRLKWAFAFPDASDVRSQIVVVGRSLFVGSDAGTEFFDRLM